MSIFRDFFVKEKPVFTGITRGVGGFGVGGGSGGGATVSVSGSGDRTGKIISWCVSPAIGPTTKIFSDFELYGEI